MYGLVFALCYLFGSHSRPLSTWVGLSAFQGLTALSYLYLASNPTMAIGWNFYATTILQYA